MFRRSRDGRWVAKVPSKKLGYRNGRPDTREFVRATPEEALEARAQFLAARANGFVIPKGRPPYVGEWLLHWLHNVVQGTVCESTWERTYRQKAEDHVIPYLGQVLLPDLTEEDVEAWHRDLRRHVSVRTGRPLSLTTIGQAHGVLSMALKVAVIRGRVPRNVAANVRRPAAGDAERPEPPAEDEVRAVMDACAGWRTGPRWLTDIATGLRQGEGLGLMWPLVHDLDTVDASIKVEWELVRCKWRHGCEDPHACGERYHTWACPPRDCPRVRVSGRPHACIPPGDRRCCEPGCEEHARRCPQRHGGGLRLKRPKSAKSRRTVPLAPFAAAPLARWRTEQKAEQLACPDWQEWAHDPACCPGRPRRQLVCPDCQLPARPGLLVFTTPSGRPTDPKADWDDWSALLGAAGVEHYGTHGNRHGFGTLLLEAGTDIKVVSELMGHSTTYFTQSVYQHVRKQLGREAADAMQQRLSPRAGADRRLGRS